MGHYRGTMGHYKGTIKGGGGGGGTNSVHPTVHHSAPYSSY